MQGRTGSVACPFPEKSWYNYKKPLAASISARESSLLLAGANAQSHHSPPRPAHTALHLCNKARLHYSPLSTPRALPLQPPLHSLLCPHLHGEICKPFSPRSSACVSLQRSLLASRHDHRTIVDQHCNFTLRIGRSTELKVQDILEVESAVLNSTIQI